MLFNMAVMNVCIYLQIKLHLKNFSVTQTTFLVLTGHVGLVAAILWFLFIFGCRISFFGRFQSFLLMVVQQLIVILVCS